MSTYPWFPFPDLRQGNQPCLYSISGCSVILCPICCWHLGCTEQMQFLYIFTASTSSPTQSVMLKDWMLVQLGGSILALMLCMTIERWKALSCLCALQSSENMRTGAGALRWQTRQMQAEPWPLHIHSGLEIIPLSWLLALLALTGNRCSSRTFCEANGWSKPWVHEIPSCG